MKELFSLFTALILSIGLWAETMDGVKYIDANGQEQTANNVAEINNSSSNLEQGWYIVYGGSVQTGTLVCKGGVHLILADGAMLYAYGDDSYNSPAIQVSGDGNSLTIYGQINQSGVLIAKGKEYSAGIGGGNGNKSGSDITINGGWIEAYGGDYAAGIGGGSSGSGSDITINGGNVTATGGYGAAGIGGGNDGSGFNITIKGGTIVAKGGEGASCIGGGNDGSGFNIIVATDYGVKAGNNYPPAPVIENDGSDLADKLAGKQYATILFDPLADIRAAAIAEINVAIENVNLFPAEVEYINFIKSSVLLDEEPEMINMDKKLALNYIKLHAAKLEAISEIKAEMGDLAKIESIYKFIGCPAIEEAIDTNRIAQAKSDALAKLKEIGTILEDIYARGKTEGLAAGDSIGYTRGLAEGDSIGYARGLAVGDSIGYMCGKTEGITQGKAEAKTELLGSMATPCTDCTVVEIKRDTSALTLYAPDRVIYKKQK